MNCATCGREINGYNTKGGRLKIRKCGKCYLKWKKEERSRRGQT